MNMNYEPLSISKSGSCSETLLFDCLKSSFVLITLLLLFLTEVLFDKNKSERMDRYMPGRNRKGMQHVPSLLDLCIQTAIDNVRYLGNVGGTDEQFLGQILPHCTVDQLKHVEDSTEVRDQVRGSIFLNKKFWLDLSFFLFSFAGKRSYPND